MKKTISFSVLIIVIVLAIAHTLYVRCHGEDSSNNETAIVLPPIDESLRNRVDSFLVNTPHNGELGLMVYDITAGKEVYSHNKDSLMRPASCMKLLTCIAALRYMGSNHIIRNRLFTNGQLVGDTLIGNVILKTEFDAAFNRDTLNQMVDTLKSRGINFIKGDILIDMMFCDAMAHEEHWIIGDLRTRYMGLVLQGLPRMKKEMLSALSYKGIKVIEGEIRYGKLNPNKATMVAENNNLLHKMIEKSLNVSSNINAEALLYPLGYIINNGGEYRENGKRLLRNFLRNEIKAEPYNVCNIDDGCGLCPNDRLSPDILVKLLIYASNNPYIYDEIVNDMPLAGVNGTLYKRMHDPDIKGKLRGKTGTLTREGGISTLAGYFFGKDDHLIAFAIMNNGWGVEDGRAWQDKLCQHAFKPTKIMGELEKIQENSE